MEKNWHTAPWTVRLLIIYWIFPLASNLLILAVAAFLMSASNPIEIWKIPYDLFRVKFDAMPISASIDAGISVMYFSAAYYAWKLSRGSGVSRLALEIFSWITILYTSVNLLFPELRYLELDHLSPSFLDTPINFLILGVFLLGLQLVVLYLLRTAGVRRYANVF